MSMTMTQVDELVESFVNGNRQGVLDAIGELEKSTSIYVTVMVFDSLPDEYHKSVMTRMLLSRSDW